MSTSLCVVFLQQDDERIIQEIQKEGEAELNKKCTGQSQKHALKMMSFNSYAVRLSAAVLLCLSAPLFSSLHYIITAKSP